MSMILLTPSGDFTDIYSVTCFWVRVESMHLECLSLKHVIKCEAVELSSVQIHRKSVKCCSWQQRPMEM